MLLETERLLLRNWRESDVDSYLVMAGDVGYNCFSRPGRFLVRNAAEAQEKIQGIILTLPSRAVVRFDNRRGTAERWIREGKPAVKMTRLGCHRFRSSEVRLCLRVIAYNLRSLCRRLVLPQRIGSWPLTSLQQRLAKPGRRLLKHACYYWLLLAESHLTRRLFGAVLRRIESLPLPAG
jgi:hypothetical protein